MVFLCLVKRVLLKSTPCGEVNYIYSLVFMCLVFGYGCSSAAKDLGIHWSIGLIMAAAVPFVLTGHFFIGA